MHVASHFYHTCSADVLRSKCVRKVCASHPHSPPPPSSQGVTQHSRAADIHGHGTVCAHLSPKVSPTGHRAGALTTSELGSYAVSTRYVCHSWIRGYWIEVSASEHTRPQWMERLVPFSTHQREQLLRSGSKEAPRRWRPMHQICSSCQGCAQGSSRQASGDKHTSNGLEAWRSLKARCEPSATSRVVVWLSKLIDSDPFPSTAVGFEEALVNCERLVSQCETESSQDRYPCQRRHQRKCRQCFSSRATQLIRPGATLLQVGSCRQTVQSHPPSKDLQMWTRTKCQRGRASITMAKQGPVAKKSEESPRTQIAEAQIVHTF